MTVLQQTFVQSTEAELVRNSASKPHVWSNGGGSFISLSCYDPKASVWLYEQDPG
jgi:hypothetical protein